MKDTSHLVALVDGLNREKVRLASARTDSERELRRVWIAQREREIAAERAFLGMAPDAPDDDMSPEDLLRELGA